jgi:hypothetical protein
MKLAHSIATTLIVSVAALASACSDDATDDGGTATGGTGGTATGGTATGGTATGGTATGGTATGGTATGGTATGGTAGSGTGGSATGGSAGSGTGGSAGSGAVDYPTDSTQAGIEAYLNSNVYTMTGMGWRPESMASPGTAAPHLSAKRYFNETIIASTAAGNSRNAHTLGSMSIKEILDGTTVVGKAVTLKTGDTSWAYYCVSSVAGRCFTNSQASVPYYSTTSGSCACHGMGINLSTMAIPMP